MPLQKRVETINLSRGDMKSPYRRRSVPRFRQQDGKAPDMIKTDEVVKVVLVPVLTSSMILQT